MTAFVKSMMTAAVAALLLTCGNYSADARRTPRHIHPRPCRTVLVTSVPPVTVRVHKHFDRDDRLETALTYLRRHDFLTVSCYARMTGLSRKTAKAELESFAHKKPSPICAEQRKGRRVYVLRAR